MKEMREMTREDIAKLKKRLYDESKMRFNKG